MVDHRRMSLDAIATVEPPSTATAVVVVVMAIYKLGGHRLRMAGQRSAYGEQRHHRVEGMVRTDKEAVPMRTEELLQATKHLLHQCWETVIRRNLSAGNNEVVMIVVASASKRYKPHAYDCLSCRPEYCRSRAGFAQ